MSGNKDALHKFFERDWKKQQAEIRRDNGQTKPRGAPEKKVVKDVLDWGKKYGFSLDVIEASGFDRVKMAMVHDTKIDPGYSDLSGNDRMGLSCYIECKAKGRRSQLKDHQREFLIRKINSGAFACVTDSVDFLHNLYHQWLVLKLKTRELSVLKPMNMVEAYCAEKNPTALLMAALPVKRQQKKRRRKNKGLSELDILLDE